MDWFTVDKVGLGKLLERKGKPFVLYELIQNAWDEDTTSVNVQIKRVPGSPYVSLRVTDDNPAGFVNLSHAFTLFAESNKKGDAEKRGRFNLGEKLVLALCRRAEITSTTGTIIFDEEGRHKTRKATSGGSIFYGELKMTDAEMEECRKAIELLIPPEHITTGYVIGEQAVQPLFVPVRGFTAEFEEPLPTAIADIEGNVRRSIRKTKVTLHRVRENAGEKQAYLYEMGIPVVEIDGRFHVNVHQKVPLNFDRDNVTPQYLAKIHALTAEYAMPFLTAEDVNRSWVKVGMQESGDDLSNETVRKIADLRFGEKRVAYDPSDPEANNIAITKGYQVIHGGAMSGTEWDLMKRANAILPAGQVTPSKPDATVPRVTVPEDKWTPAMHHVAWFCKAVAPHVIGVDVHVVITNNPTVGEIATYGSRTINFNMGRLGKKWFEGSPAKIIELVIHEFAHEKSGNHLSEAYYDALTEIGAKMTVLALEHREIFEQLDGVHHVEYQVETEDV